LDARWLPLVMGEGLPQGWRYRRIFDDLRGTFVSRSARHGGTPLEIADITGHGVDILDKHYLCRDGSLGDHAIRKLEGERIPQTRSQIVKMFQKLKAEKMSNNKWLGAFDSNPDWRSQADRLDAARDFSQRTPKQPLLPRRVRAGFPNKSVRARKGWQ
jgi:hypothetical protein